MRNRESSVVFKVIMYIVLVLLAIMSLAPFWIMLMNATRSTYEIPQLDPKAFVYVQSIIFSSFYQLHSLITM